MRRPGTVPFDGDQSVKATAGRNTDGGQNQTLGKRPLSQGGYLSTLGTQRSPTRPGRMDGGPLLSSQFPEAPQRPVHPPFKCRVGIVFWGQILL